MKKRLIALLTVMILSLTMVPRPSLAKVDQQEFTPRIAESLDISADEWLESANSRALLAVLLLMDLSQQTGFDIDRVDFSFGGFLINYFGLSLSAIFYTKDYELLNIQYTPMLGTANYSVSDPLGKVSTSQFRSVVASTTDKEGLTHYEISVSDILTVTMALKDIISGE